MPRRKPTDKDLNDREILAKEMIEFRKNNLFTQVKLAEVLQVSRRTIQDIEGAKITPYPSTLRAWRTLVHRYKKANNFNFD